MTKPSNISAIEKTTKQSWSEWLTYLEAIGAKDLTHKEIAQKVYDKLGDGWWAQSVTVAYEQHIGRRQPGQRNDGGYEISVSKTLTGNMDAALQEWLHLVAGKTEFSNVAISGEPKTSETEKWRHWRCTLSDGSRVNAAVYQKTPEKPILPSVIPSLKPPKQPNNGAHIGKLFWTICSQDSSFC